MTNFKQAIRDGVGDLLAEVAAGEISAADAERELDVCKALCELIVQGERAGPAGDAIVVSVFRSSSGSLAMLAAMRWASSRVSRLSAVRRAGK
jgi:hypothetical protein